MVFREPKQCGGSWFLGWSWWISESDLAYFILFTFFLVSEWSWLPRWHIPRLPTGTLQVLEDLTSPQSPPIYTALWWKLIKRNRDHISQISAKHVWESFDSNFRFSIFSMERGSDDPRSRCIWATYCHRLGHDWMIEQLSKGFINPDWFNWLDSDKLGSPLMINKPTDWKIQVDIDNWMVQ